MGLSEKTQRDLQELGVRSLTLRGEEATGFCPNPDHYDSNPSFSYNVRTGAFNCFGCGLRGRGMSSLYDKCGRPYSGLSPIYETMNLSLGTVERPVHYFVPTAVLSTLEEKYDYLERRGVPASTQKEWGVLYSKEDNRYVVPVRYSDGMLVGFVGLADENSRSQGAKKVMYSVGLPLRWVLLGSHLIARGDYVVLVEGAVDAMRVWNVGERHVVALLHSKLSRGQAETLAALSPTVVYVMFDNDEAGNKASLSVEEWAAKSRFCVRRVPYIGEDPAAASQQDLVSACAWVQQDYRNLRNKLFREDTNGDVMRWGIGHNEYEGSPAIGGQQL